MNASDDARRLESEGAGAAVAGSTGAAGPEAHKQAVGGQVELRVLGMSLGPIPQSHPSHGELEGLYILADPESPAREVGLKHGDIITAVKMPGGGGFAPVRSAEDLTQAIDRAEQGPRVLLVRYARRGLDINVAAFRLR